MLGILLYFIFLYLLSPSVTSYKIIRDSCPVCPPCAMRPPALMQKRTRVSFESTMPRTYQFSTEDEPFRLAVVKENREDFAHKTVDLSKYEVKLISSHAMKNELDRETTTPSPPSSTTVTKRIPSTIPTATPFVPRVTRIPSFLKERHSEKTKKTRIPSDLENTTPTPDSFGRKTVASMKQQPIGTEQINEVGFNADASLIETNTLSTTIEAASAPEEIPLVPAGYQTNPMFAADEVHIEDDKCNDKDLQRILVEGLRVDDSIGSKRSIGALLNVGKISTASVLCSDQEMAFRLVARRHCQLSAGKTTCVLFVL